MYSQRSDLEPPALKAIGLSACFISYLVFFPRRDRRPEYHEYSEGGPAQRRARSAAPQDWRREPGSGAPRGRQLRRLQTIDDAPYEARYVSSLWKEGNDKVQL